VPDRSSKKIQIFRSLKGPVLNILEKLRRNRLVNSVVKRSRADKLIDWYLSRFPVRMRTSSGLVYKIESIPSLIAANEVFAADSYGRAIRIVAPETFVDLGANVGYFPVAVAEATGSRRVKGLCIEPNPALTESLLFHIRENRLENVQTKRGAVGFSDAGGEVDFFINPSHIASSLSPDYNPLLPVIGESRKIRVPALVVSEEWNRVFPGRRVNLLKIDIEGAEVPFLRGQSAFLTQVDAILIEWHLWVTDRNEIVALLERNGFMLHLVFDEDQHAGTALFLKRG
jgi:FkbM family methyltransferase